MKWRVSPIAASAGLVGLVACRAIVGIEEQTVGADTSTGAADGGDAAVEAGADAAVTPGPPPVEECVDLRNTSSVTECVRCCRERATPAANQRLDDILRVACLCQDERRCVGPCSDDLCMGRPPGQPPNECVKCMTDNIPRAECADGLDACRDDPACGSVGDCIVGSCK